MPVTRVDDVDLSYALTGEGPETVVLVGGLTDDASAWALQAPALVEAGFRVLCFDNRGAGASGKPPGPYSTELLASDLAGLIDALELGEVHLVGSSMGGMIAQCLALARPERLRSLTLASTFAEPSAWCTRLFALWRDIADAQGVPFVLRDMLQWAFTPEFVDAHAADVAAVESELEEAAMPLAAYQAQLAAVAGHNTTGRLGGIAVPTLVLAGERDILVPVELTRRAHAEIPGARWATIPGGHACAWEAPDAFNAAVLAFLGDVVT